ncbi:hypothetical protein [Pleionea sp. CnH1-48]|uniref:hypothetical protein n=1 Tax=Pleionea sp. CnH1-48 TaxID=2954494 RepID=UPI0020983231|nr:hypothetical protein [Pleionea sp. CnH1-48]MCO7227078.1 hypothetical protein [Pleionea sp. CnH1-48]
MLALICGIVLGVAFHEFWMDLFNKAKSKMAEWSNGSSKSSAKEEPVVFREH